MDVSESEVYSSSDDEFDNDDQVGEASTRMDNKLEEHWDEVPSEVLDNDLDLRPLPEPASKKTKLQEVNALVFWFVYFLLLWQTSCKISDNGMAWLLEFIIQFLKVFGIETSNGFLSELIVLLPSSLYLLKQFIN